MASSQSQDRIEEWANDSPKDPLALCEDPNAQTLANNRTGSCPRKTENMQMSLGQAEG